MLQKLKQQQGGDSMDDKKIIIEYFSNEYPSMTIMDILPFSDREEDKHYYEVKGTDEKGDFETSVFVDNGTVLILPE